MTEHIGENSNKLTNPDTPFHERLRILCGYVENGTDTVVKVFQDDATGEWCVRIGSETAGRGRLYIGKDFLGAFETAFQDERNDPFR